MRVQLRVQLRVHHAAAIHSRGGDDREDRSSCSYRARHLAALGLDTQAFGGSSPSSCKHKHVPRSSAMHATTTPTSCPS